jgi:hypothetical protein
LLTFLARFWRGQIPLAKTFWLGWAVPVIGGNILITIGAWWLISHVGLNAFYALIAAIAAYGIAAVVPVWRSASAYSGHKVLKYAARAIASIASSLQIAVVGSVVYAFVSVQLGVDSTHDPDRVAEKTAIPSESHPMAGFWKSRPNDNFGLAIAPAEGKLYSVSFCGPGGCFKPGTYRPDTPLVGDEDYQVVANDTLLIRGRDGWSTYKRAASRGDENCQPN